LLCGVELFEVDGFGALAADRVTGLSFLLWHCHPRDFWYPHPCLCSSGKLEKYKTKY
jgi:hypothetical protein